MLWRKTPRTPDNALANLAGLFAIPMPALQYCKCPRLPHVNAVGGRHSGSKGIKWNPLNTSVTVMNAAPATSLKHRLRSSIGQLTLRVMWFSPRASRTTLIPGGGAPGRAGFFATNSNPLLYGDKEASTTPSLIMARIEVYTSSSACTGITNGFCRYGTSVTKLMNILVNEKCRICGRFGP